MLCKHDTLLSSKVQGRTFGKMTAFWDKALCSLVEVDRRFRDAYYLDLQSDWSFCNLIILYVVYLVMLAITQIVHVVMIE
jgi:hypothetical protein